MATYQISAVYEYSGEVEADSEEEAYQTFIANLDSYYFGVYSYEVEEIEDEDE